MKKDNINVIVKIVERADDIGLLMFDRISLIMDLDCVSKELDLRFDDLLNADNYNFSHDIVGIQKNLNRQTKKMDNFFVPRFAR